MERSPHREEPPEREAPTERSPVPTTRENPETKTQCSQNSITRVEYCVHQTPGALVALQTPVGSPFS